MGQINTAALVQDRPLLNGNDAVTNHIKVRFPKVCVPLSGKKKKKTTKNKNKNPKYN